MSSAPLVSIVMPLYKKSFYLEALDSARVQDYPNLELVVCDDSGDSEISKSILSMDFPFPVNYLKNDPPLGEVLNHVKCIKEAKGHYIKFLHDDDALLENCVSELVEAFELSSSVILATCARSLIDEGGRELPDKLHSSCPFEQSVLIEGASLLSFLSQNIVNFVGEPSCVLFRRSDVIGYGHDLMSIDGTVMYWLGDLTIYSKLLTQGDLAFVNQRLTKYRISESQGSKNEKDEEIIRRSYGMFSKHLGGLQIAPPESPSQVLIKPLLSPESRYQKYDLLQALRKAYAFSDVDAGKWLASRQLTIVQREKVAERVSVIDFKCVAIVIDLESNRAGLSKTLSSFSRCEWRFDWKIVVFTSLDDFSSTVDCIVETADVSEAYSRANDFVGQAFSDWIVFLQPGDEFLSSGLLMAGLEMHGVDNCNAVSFDEVYRQDGKLGLAFRPAFNLDYFLGFPAGLSKRWIFRRTAILKLQGLGVSLEDAFELDLILRMAIEYGIATFGHVSEPLFITDAPVLKNHANEYAAIIDHLRCRGYAEAKLSAELPGRYHIDYGHSIQPLVTIVIPTKNQISMLQRCVETLLEVTAYSNYEIIIVDNCSDEPEALHWLEQLRSLGTSKIRVLNYSHKFNFSAINNMAVRHARGEYVVLLNNDTAVIDPNWLSEMLNHALRPEVGIVGAKLLYPTGRIQHAGVILGLKGPADHIFIGDLSSSSGYMHRLEVDQNFSAVTAACLLIRKSLYEQVGGMDEISFKVSYNDVDLCLKIREAGFLIVWASKAILLHEGSVSQKMVDKAAHAEKRARFISEQDRMYDKWLPALARDPAYNQNLSLVKGSGFVVADSQISWRPLESWRPMPVVLAHPADLFGCGHYRVIQPFNALKESGLIEGALSVGLMHVADLERYSPDVVLLQRQISEERLEAMRRMKRFSNAFKVYELDDYLPNLPIKSIYRNKMPKDVIKSLSRGLSFVDRFVVSTQPLAEAFADYHSDIRVVENRLDPRWWKDLPQSLRSQSSKPRVGWAGGASHTGDLELIFDVVKELASEVEWVFFGMCPEKLRPYVQEFHPGVPIVQYPAKLASLNLDLALAPVEQNFFNECKSNLRLLEYGICGYPVICSDVRCYAGDLPVTRVKNRFKDWVEAIRTHISDANASGQKGLVLKDKVLQEWMLEGGNLAAWRKAWLPDS